MVICSYVLPLELANKPCFLRSSTILILSLFTRYFIAISPNLYAYPSIRAMISSLSNASMVEKSNCYQRDGSLLNDESLSRILQEFMRIIFSKFTTRNGSPPFTDFLSSF